MHKLLLSPNRVVRLRETLKHPDQAAIAARLPIVGERVPMRAFWSRRPVRPARVMRHGTDAALHSLDHAAHRVPAEVQHTLRDNAPRARAAADRAAHTLRDNAPRARAAADRAAHTIRHTAVPARSALHAVADECGPVRRTTRDITQRMSWTRMRIPLPYVLGTVGLVAALMYFTDRQSGRRRRALVRDKLTHTQRVMRRDLPRKVEKRGRFFQGVVTGIQHNAGELIHRDQMPPPDDDTLKARVRSQVLRNAELNSGEIHVEAYEGCVTLRGQLSDESTIRQIVSATRHVSGVREVRNYLHTPGTDPPNKHDSLNGQSASAPSRLLD
jgi:hypothetical protein